MPGFAQLWLDAGGVGKVGAEVSDHLTGSCGLALGYQHFLLIEVWFEFIRLHETVGGDDGAVGR